MSRPVCPNCKYKTNFGKNERSYALHRIYIKKRGSWKTIGWICPRCGYIILDGIPSGMENTQISIPIRNESIQDSIPTWRNNEVLNELLELQEKYNLLEEAFKTLLQILEDLPANIRRKISLGLTETAIISRAKKLIEE